MSRSFFFQSSAFKLVFTIERILYGVGALLLVSVFFVARYLGSTISNPPVQLIIEETRLISKGARTRRIKVKTRDEIGMLSSAFNSMTENLSRTTTTLDRLEQEIERRKKERV